MNDETLPLPPHVSEIGPLDDYKKLGIEEAVALTRQFSAYAPPSAWGPWIQVASHGGAINYSITYEAIGNTNVLGAVNYHGSGGQITQKFNDSIDFRTGDVWANIFVCFKGLPLGSAVRGTVNP